MPAAKPRRRDLAPRRQRSQRERERERERRVSDADASYNGPATTTRTLNSAIPQSKHAKKQLFPLLRPGPSPKAPRQTSGSSTTKTDPNPILCFSPRTQTRHENEKHCTQHATTCQAPHDKEHRQLHRHDHRLKTRREDVEVLKPRPRLTVPDRIQPPTRPTDRDVEQVRLRRRTRHIDPMTPRQTQLLPLRRAAEHLPTIGNLIHNLEHRTLTTPMHMQGDATPKELSAREDGSWSRGTHARAPRIVPSSP